MSKNIAYTKEYQVQRSQMDYLFQDRFLNSSEDRIIADGKFCINIKTYIEKINLRVMDAKFISVYDRERQLVFEQKCCYDKDFFCYIPHKNGNEYLLFSIDLYGYSILNLNTLSVFHYMPEEVLKGGETFIWTSVDYSGSNMIATHGCFWACDSEFEIYDFSEPEELPYKLLVRHEDLEPQYDNWLFPIGWISHNEYGYHEVVGKEKTYKTIKF